MILGYVLMTRSGIPLWFRFFQDLTDNKKEKYELFSSAIAAVFSLINETFSDDIKEIIMSNHRLFLLKNDEIMLLLIGSKNAKVPAEEFERFVESISSRVDPDISFEEEFLREVIDTLAGLELKIEELNTLEKLSRNL